MLRRPAGWKERFAPKFDSRFTIVVVLRMEMGERECVCVEQRKQLISKDETRTSKMHGQLLPNAVARGNPPNGRSQFALP